MSYRAGDRHRASREFQRDRAVGRRSWWRLLNGPGREQYRIGGDSGHLEGRYLVEGVEIVIDDDPGALIAGPWHYFINDEEVSEQEYALAQSEYKAALEIR